MGIRLHNGPIIPRRPRRGTITSFVELDKWKGVEKLILIDVVSCFDRIPHDRLMEELQKYEMSESVLPSYNRQLPDYQDIRQRGKGVHLHR